MKLSSSMFWIFYRFILIYDIQFFNYRFIIRIENFNSYFMTIIRIPIVNDKKSGIPDPLSAGAGTESVGTGIKSVGTGTESVGTWIN